MLVLIDNGHGAETPGKRSPDGLLREYAWTRTVARMVCDILAAKGITARLLVPEEWDVPLVTRCARANAHAKRDKDTLLVSIHVNAAGDGTRWMNADGFEVYTSPGQTASDRLAECIYAAVEDGTPFRMRADLKDGDHDREARFYILQHTACPAVLCECGFMDNPTEARWLGRESSQATVALAIAEGIEDYIKK